MSWHHSLKEVRALGELLQRSRRILAFTGAGISTASGIPDFRGPQGIWQRWKPVYYQEFMASHEARVRHWEYKLEGWQAFREARPNAAHLALLELERARRLQAVVTQNIDGLHQLAGHAEERVIELHGTNRWVECQSCKKLSDPDPVFQEFARTRQPPLCRCGGFLKPATVSFGQEMPHDKLAQAFRLAETADLVLAVGSTLEVEPAASVPRQGKRSGASYAIVNRGPTAQDHLADLRIEGDAVAVLAKAVREFRRLSRALCLLGGMVVLRFCCASFCLSFWEPS